jgi:glycosyltransferase involved in cell wall biosynthesis
MACGTPVVATNVGGLPELIESGVSGYLCEVGDVDGMAAVVRHLLRDCEGYESIAAAGRERAFTRFNRDAIVDEYEKVYRGS